MVKGWFFNKVKYKDMEKKVYTAPECLVVEMELVNMIAGSVIEVEPGNGDDFVLESNRHRGEWGNLWSKGQ